MHLQHRLYGTYTVIIISKIPLRISSRITSNIIPNTIPWIRPKIIFLYHKRISPEIDAWYSWKNFSTDFLGTHLSISLWIPQEILHLRIFPKGFPLRIPLIFFFFQMVSINILAEIPSKLFCNNSSRIFFKVAAIPLRIFLNCLYWLLQFSLE